MKYVRILQRTIDQESCGTATLM